MGLLDDFIIGFKITLTSYLAIAVPFIALFTIGLFTVLKGVMDGGLEAIGASVVFLIWTVLIGIISFFISFPINGLMADSWVGLEKGKKGFMTYSYIGLKIWGATILVNLIMFIPFIIARDILPAIQLIFWPIEVWLLGVMVGAMYGWD